LSTLYRTWITSNLILDFEIQQHLGSLKHVIYIIIRIRDTGVTPIECTSMVTRTAMNYGFPEMTNLAYTEQDVPDLGLDHFVHAHTLRGVITT
jgi:hypothetical protein